MPDLPQIMSRHWAAPVSVLLHGTALALLLWHLTPQPITAPASAQIPVVVEVVTLSPPVPQPPEPAVEPEIKIPEPMPLPEPPPPPLAEEPPPLIESTIAEVNAPPPPPPEVKPDPKPEPKPQVVPRPKPVPPPPQTVQAPTPPVTTAPATPSPPPAPPTQQALAAPLVPPQPVGPPPDYVGLVRQQLERFKQYPRVAQQRRLQGQVLLSLTLDRGGRVLAYRLVKRSGHDILDREVEEMVRRAGSLPPFPAQLRGDQLEVVVPIEFFLQG